MISPRRFLAVVAAIGGVVCVLILQIGPMRKFTAWQPARVAALVVFAGVVLFGTIVLVDKVTTVL